MAFKWLRDNTVQITNQTWIGNDLVHQSKADRRRYAFAEATFRRKKPKPLTATPFKVYEIEYNQTPYYRISGNNTYVGTVVYVYGSEVLYTYTQRLDGKLALNKARAKISGGNQDLGEALVELDQTIDLIKKNLERIGKIGDALRKGEWSKLDSLIKGKTPDSVKKMKPSKRLSSGYLEIMFGILPLMSSVHTAVEAYGNGMLTRGSKVSAVSGQKRINFNSGWRPLDGVGRASFSGRVRNRNLATLNSYGLVNPLLMAWQRVPYSFVIDWFIPIGSILGSLTAEAGLEDVLQTYTDVTYRSQHNSFGWNWREAEYLRKVPGILPIIGNPFGREAQLSIGKLISSVALIRQRFP